MQELETISTVQDCDKAPGERSATVDGASRLLRLADLAQELETAPVAEEARELAARVAEGRFYVACVGQFKRGKSTLLNALVGHEVVPTGFVPVTAVPTVIRLGDVLHARVRMRDGSWERAAMADLKEYVTEELNPENKKAVDGAEVYVPSPLLASGMCFVDTPGLGSVFTGNTATTQAFIPQIDAAVVVVGADPPIAGEELALVEAVGRQVQDLILVINKADRTTDPERAAAVKFTREILEKRLHRPMGDVFEVNAAERMEGRGPLRDWENLVASQHRLVEDSARNLVRAAGDRGLQRLSEQLLAVISEDREALQRPIEESERRIELMKQTISEAERSMRELNFLMMAEQQRISDLFIDRHRQFFRSASMKSESEFEQALSSVPRGFGPHYRRRIMRLAQEIARNKVMPWLKPEQEGGKERWRFWTIPSPGENQCIRSGHARLRVAQPPDRPVQGLGRRYVHCHGSGCLWRRRRKLRHSRWTQRAGAWHFSVGQMIHASPMSYAVGGREYFAVAAGSDIFSFALP